MAHAHDQSRSGVSRRDALRLLAASTTTVAAGSVIISQPAFADNGSVDCGYLFRSPPTMQVDLTNEESKRDTLSISIRNTKGECECNPKATPTFRYAYYVEIPGRGSGGIGWIGSDAASVSNPPDLWDVGGGSVTVSVGVQVTCPGTPNDVIQCWYGTAQIQVLQAKFKVKQDYLMTVNNSDSNPPGIPVCQTSGSARLLTGGSINLVGGLIATTDAEIADDPAVDLGAIDSDTTTTTTTTTTDKPGNGPKPGKDSNPPSSTTTTSPSTTTTTSPSTTTTSTPSTTTTSTPSTTSTTTSTTSTSTSTTLPPG